MNDLERSRSRLGRAMVLTVVAALTAAAFASAAQAAPRWKVGGAFLASGASKTFTATSGQVSLGISSAGISFQCSSGSMTGKIEGTSAGVKGKESGVIWTLTGCQLKGTSTAICQVHTEGKPAGTIGFDLLKGTLGTYGGAPTILYTPEVSTELTRAVQIEGAECSWDGFSVRTTGQLEAKISKGMNVEALSVPVEFPATALPGSTWSWAGNPGTIVESLSMALSSGEAFGVSEG
jgi:hypothetical protein